jgi:hypothetical protein
MQGSASSGQMRQYHGEYCALCIVTKFICGWNLLVISVICYSSSRLHPSTRNTSPYLQLMIPSHLRSVRIQSSGRILKMRLGHWTVATSTAHPLHVNVLPIEIAKALCRKTVSLDVRLIFNLFLPILGGKGQQRMRKYMRMPF